MKIVKFIGVDVKNIGELYLIQKMAAKTLRK